MKGYWVAYIIVLLYMGSLSGSVTKIEMNSIFVSELHRFYSSHLVAGVCERACEREHESVCCGLVYLIAY